MNRFRNPQLWKRLLLFTLVFLLLQALTNLVWREDVVLWSVRHFTDLIGRAVIMAIIFSFIFKPPSSAPAKEVAEVSARDFSYYTGLFLFLLIYVIIVQGFLLLACYLAFRMLTDEIPNTKDLFLKPLVVSAVMCFIFTVLTFVWDRIRIKSNR